MRWIALAMMVACGPEYQTSCEQHVPTASEQPKQGYWFCFDNVESAAIPGDGIHYSPNGETRLADVTGTGPYAVDFDQVTTWDFDPDLLVAESPDVTGDSWWIVYTFGTGVIITE